MMSTGWAESPEVVQELRKSLSGVNMGGGAGYILFVEPYEDGGYYGFIKPFGSNGRQNNVFFTDKAVAPLLDDIIEQYVDAGQSLVEARVEVVYTLAEPASPKGPRAVGVWVR